MPAVVIRLRIDRHLTFGKSDVDAVSAKERIHVCQTLNVTTTEKSNVTTTEKSNVITEVKGAM